MKVIAHNKLLEKAMEPELSYILVKLFMCLKESLIVLIVGRFHVWSLYLRMLGRDLQLKAITLLVLFLSLVKSLKNLQIKSLLIILRNMAFFVFCTVSGLLNKLQIFWQFVSFTRSGARHAGLSFTISSLMGFCVSGIQLIFPFPQL